jgi:hypothetical protein
MTSDAGIDAKGNCNNNNKEANRTCFKCEDKHNNKCMILDDKSMTCIKKPCPPGRYCNPKSFTDGSGTHIPAGSCQSRTPQ